MVEPIKKYERKIDALQTELSKLNVANVEMQSELSILKAAYAEKCDKLDKLKDTVIELATDPYTLMTVCWLDEEKQTAHRGKIAEILDILGCRNVLAEALKQKEESFKLTPEQIASLPNNHL